MADQSPMTEEEILRQLTEYQKWKVGAQGSEFSLFDYLCCSARMDDLFAFHRLLFPPLVEHDGVAFLADRFGVEEYEDWRDRGTVPTEIQRTMNHVHIHTLFQNQEMSVELARAAARRIAETWTLVFEKNGLRGEVLGESLEDLTVALVKA